MRELYDEAQAIVDDCERFIKENQRLVDEVEYLMGLEKNADKLLALRATKAILLRQIGIIFTEKQRAIATQNLIKTEMYMGFSHALYPKN